MDWNAAIVSSVILGQRINANKGLEIIELWSLSDSSTGGDPANRWNSIKTSVHPFIRGFNFHFRVILTLGIETLR